MAPLNLNNSMNLKMHPKILTILFNHKNEILRKLTDLRGLHYLDHISILLVNSHREIIILSITPSVEFNLIAQDLWQFDRSFDPAQFSTGQLLFWDNSYTSEYYYQLKYLKEIKHNFSLGFNVLRKIEGFYLIYSFATRSDDLNLKNYYQSIATDLYSLGDYGYKELRGLYEQYTDIVLPPCAVVDKHVSPIRNRLKLVVNNK